jgi:hypothetical protein
MSATFFSSDSACDSAKELAGTGTNLADAKTASHGSGGLSTPARWRATTRCSTPGWMRKHSTLAAVSGTVPTVWRDSSRDTQDSKKDVVVNILLVAGLFYKMGRAIGLFICSIHIRWLSSRDFTVARQLRIAPDTSPPVYAAVLYLLKKTALSSSYLSCYPSTVTKAINDRHCHCSAAWRTIMELHSQYGGPSWSCIVNDPAYVFVKKMTQRTSASANS